MTDKITANIGSEAAGFDAGIPGKGAEQQNKPKPMAWQ
jgi:hypothetical protein